jgi:hypothetical protein
MNIITEEILSDYSRQHTLRLAEKYKGNKEAIIHLFKMMLSGEIKSAQRAAWVMRYAADEDTLSTETILKNATKLLPSKIHSAITRSILNILDERKINEKQKSKVWHLVFHLLTNTYQDIAIHAIGISILYKIALPYPELLRELEEQVNIILEKNPSPAVLSKKRNLFTKTKKRR